MHNDIGYALEAFEGTLQRLREVASSVPALDVALFDGFEDWERQLAFKLAPRLSGEGCLIILVAGGTNTGKSTVFNMLAGADLSPVSPYGAHTKRALAAANPRRYAECLQPGRLLPDAFTPCPHDPTHPERLTEDGDAPLSLFVTQRDELPDRLILLDTPDIDSIVKENWELAKAVREAGDVVVVVITAQKYADTCVVEFVREACVSGRHVIAVMNMADDAPDDFAVTREQLAQFQEYVFGREAPEMPVFVLPRLSREDRAAGRAQAVALDDPEQSLWDYLASLDALELKKRILEDNLRSFTRQASEFIGRAAQLHEALDEIIARFEAMAHETAMRYHPAPGREVLEVVYEFARQRIRGPAAVVGPAVAGLAKVYGGIRKGVRSVFRKPPDPVETEQRITKEQRAAVSELVHDLYRRCAQEGPPLFRATAPEAVSMFTANLATLDPDAVAEAVVNETFHVANYLEAYRAAARQELERRWESDARLRRALTLAYNLGLFGVAGGMMVMLYFGGWGQDLVLSEILASLALPLVMDAVSKVWGDTMLIRKWQELQRRALEDALANYLTGPALGPLPHFADTLADAAPEMEDLVASCRIEN